MANAERIPAFVNPKSGNFEGARDALEAAGSFDIVDVQPGELESRIRESLAAGAARILIAGGDGSIRTAALAIRGTDTELAVLPAGTLNHFARDHGIPEDRADAAVTALAGSAIPVDGASVGDTLFLNTSSIGAYVRFVKAREKLEPYLGYRLASIIATLRTFIIMPSLTVDLEVDGRRETIRTPLVFIGVGERELRLPTLGNRIEGGRRGLHVIVVKGRRRARLLAMAMAAVARGVQSAARMPELDSFVVERCAISMRRHYATVALDGEAELLESPLEYRLEKDILRLVSGSRSERSPDSPGEA